MKEILRDNVLEAICKHDQDPYGLDMSGKRKINVEKAADELLQLMCYREVKAIIQGRETAQLHNNADFLIHGILKFDYPTDVIERAIEKYKSEYQ